MSKKKVKKLVLLGWDAAEWKIIKPLIDQGMMPTLKKFLEEGTSGKIATMDPPFSPMLWTSIATGKRAYDHGVMGFIEPTENGDALRPVMSSSRKVKAIWNILNQEGFKSNVIGWWPSHPADNINGVMVSNFYQQFKDPINKPWPMLEGTIHPKSMEELFMKLRVHADEMTPAIINNFIPEAAKIIEKYAPIAKDESLEENERKKAEGFIKRISGVSKNIAFCASIHNAGTYVIRNTEWDFTAIYYDTIDHLSHIGMKFHPPKMDLIDEESYEYFKDIVVAGYRYHDMMLERILNIVDKDTTVLILSDHGFHPDQQRPTHLPLEPASPAYEHSPYGFFAIKGPAIKKGETIYGASLVDITPTLLHLFGLPVGQDMEGNVLTHIFNDANSEPVDYIPSWEKVEGNDGMLRNTGQQDSWASAEAMKQLIDLGYVEKPDDNIAKAVEDATNEAKYYLARTYIDGNKYQEGIAILEEITEKKPEIVRYKMKLASVYLNVRKFKQCRELIENIKTIENYPKNKILFYEGLLNILTNRVLKAISIFNELKKNNTNPSPKLFCHLGRAYNMRFLFDKAEAEYQHAIKLDPFENMAYHGLGLSYLRRERYEEAIEAFLNAIEINNYMPNAHFHLGETLFKIGKYKEAIHAFQMALHLRSNMTRCHLWLSKCYEKLNDAENAKKHLDLYNQHSKGTRIIVSGLRRSGTSLMMQVLRELGVEIVYDETKDADEFNPQGYFEYTSAANLLNDKEWLKDMGEKAVKVHSELLKELPPNYNYKIIWMDRPMDEILSSIAKTNRKRDSVYDVKKADALTSQVTKSQAWIESSPANELLVINYNDLINNTEGELISIATFLELDFDVKEQVEKVKKIFNVDKAMV